MRNKIIKLLGLVVTVTLLAGLLSIATPVSAASVEQPTVTIASTDISKATNYTIRFKINKALTGNSTDKITIVFPGDTALNAAMIAINTSVSASPGWFGMKYLDADTAGVTVAADAINRKVTITLNAATDKIGEGAEIRIQIDGITNPSAIGSYVLTVATSQETTAAESAPYDIKAPYVAPSAGTVEVFNTAGILIYSSSGPGVIQAGMDHATWPGCTVKIGPGTYYENPVFVSGGTTVMATGAAEDTIVKGQWTVAVSDYLTKKQNVIQGLTLEPSFNDYAVNIDSGGSRTQVKNCVIRKSLVFVPNTQGSEELVRIDADDVSIFNCTFDTTAGLAKDTAIVVEDSGFTSGVTISGCTFALDADASEVDDVAIDVRGTAKVTVDSCTMVGSSGTGYQDISNNDTEGIITNNTFTGLTHAVNYDNNAIGILVLTGNTIQESTVVPGMTDLTATAAVNLVNYRNTMILENNTIINNNGYAVVFGDAADTSGTSFTGNSISGNQYGTKNADTGGGTVNAILNYWGDPIGPTADNNPGGTGDPITGPIDYWPWVSSPESSVNQPTVTIDPTDISRDSVYTIRFVTNEELHEHDMITVRLDKTSSTGVSPLLTGTVAASEGWFDTSYEPAVTSAATLTVDALEKKITVTFGTGDRIGEGAEVRIQLDTGITNPIEPGDYTLTVATSQEPVVVESAVYSVTPPEVPFLEGKVVEVYNPVGIKVYASNTAGAIQACLDYATTPGYVVKVHPGTYTESPVFLSGGTTVMATGTAEETIVKGQWMVDKTDTVTGKYNVIQGMTLEPVSGTHAVEIASGGDLTRITDCVIHKMSVEIPDTQGPEELIHIGADDVTIEYCTINTSAGKSRDTCIKVVDFEPVPIRIILFGCDIIVDSDDENEADVAIDVCCNARVTVEDCTFTGNSGIGYQDLSNGDTAGIITNNTFTGLRHAVNYSNNTTGTLALTGNTITGSTVLPDADALTATAAVNLENYRSIMKIEKNTITDNDGYAVIFGDEADISGTSFTGNTLSGNVYGTKNADTGGGSINARLNYWGAASGPTVADNPEGTGDPIVGTLEYRPWIIDPESSVGRPVVTLSNKTISHSSVYTIRFIINRQLTQYDSITIQFDPVSSTQVSTMLTGAVAASPGWFGTDYLPATTSGCVLYGDPLNRKATVLIGAGDRIGDGAEIRIQIDTGITNPAEIADYTLSIATSQEPNPVSSDPYSIAAPYVAPMPGIVEVFNPEGIKVYSANGPSAIQACLDKATSPGYMVEIGPGTYSENPVFLSGGTAVLAAGSAEETIVKGQWTIAVTDAITKKPTIIQGLTLEPAGGKVIAVNAGGDRITVKDCLIRKKSVFVPDTEGPETLITINADQVMVQNCSIDTTAGQAWDTGILVEETGPIFGTTITGCSFNLDMSSFYADDCGIDVFGGGRVTVTGCTFTGNSGIGYRNLSESYTFDSITGNAFTGLSKAVYYYNSSGQLTLKENTITGSTVAPVATAITATGAVELYGFSRVTMERNTLADNNGYSLIIGDAADPTQVSMAGNILSGNVYGTKNRNLTGMLDAILNYWGDPSGPTTVDNPGGTGDPIAGPSAGGGPIEYRPWLNAPVTSIKADQTISDGGTLDKSTTVGISYTSTCAVNGVSLMRYAANPGPSNPPYPVLEEGYYGVDSPNAACTTTLLFYNPNITQDSKVYYYDTLRRVWVMCSDQGVAGDGAYVYTVIQNYGNPSNANLGGAIFALVDQKSIPEAPYLGVPCVGEYDVPIEPVFAWGAVPGAVRYEITVSDDPSFTTIAFSHNVEDFTFYKTSAGEALDPNTTYYWKVRGILEDSYDPGTPATAYSVGIFTTESSTAFRGDVNGDGFVNVLDMTLIARIILGLD